MGEGRGQPLPFFLALMWITGGHMDLPSTMNTFCLFVWLGALWIMLS
jgi:hypothetical protein